MNKGIAGKIAVVTGASRGIGKTIALALATEGARLAICARDEDTLRLAVDEIRAQTHTDVIGIKANIGKLNDIRRLVNAAIKKYGRIDILVNNAGGAHVGGIFATTDEDWEYHIQLKLLGYIRTSREVAQHMKTSGGGKIINIVGAAAREPAPLSMVPGVTNAALLNFSKSLSKELAADRISVNCINPSTTETPLTVQTFASMATILQKTPEEIRQQAVQRLNGSLINPEEIAHIVLFLASDTANAITGASITVDAGSTLGIW